MKLHQKWCAVLAALLLLQLLAGCRPQAGEASPGPEPDPSPTRTQGQETPPTPTPTPQGTDAPATQPPATPEPELWDPEHRLELDLAPAAGLELPVWGATGYASVELPLWPRLPQGEEGKLTTIYAPPEPAPAAETAQTSQPAALADGPETPAPTAGAEESPPPTEGLPPESAPPTGEPEVTREPTPEPTLEPTPEPTPEPAPEPTPEPTPTPDPMEGALLVLEPGTAFRILKESGAWWQVLAQGVTGWVEHRYCLINLPDVVPSMIYNDTNAYSSVYVSCGKSIPNITGKALYQAKADNPRLGRREFMMPVLYAMAKNVCQAQQNALAEGNTLVLYEGFRPYDAQTAVAKGLGALAKRDGEVKAGISTSPWSISWFIATGVSNHQRGYAIDVSLAKVTRAHMARIGKYGFVQVDEYEEYTMPTAIHELSMAAATFTAPVDSFSGTAWKRATLAPAMAANQPALALQRYCTSAKLTPLSSEWWHFNDLAAHSQARAYPSRGDYRIQNCLSAVPG